MAEPTLLGDIIQPAWSALTPEQRTCWHFWALKHPQLTQLNELRTLYGQQAHYSRNANLAITEDSPLLEEPPTTETLPTPIEVTAAAWPLQSQLPDESTARSGVTYLEITNATPTNVTAIVTQGYTTKRRGGGRPPRIRHVTIIPPGSTGHYSLQEPTGYYASTAGDNRFATIKGRTAQRKTSLPLAKIKVINVENGKVIRQSVQNPFGGAPKKTNRARATAIQPDSGVNHYP